FNGWDPSAEKITIDGEVRDINGKSFDYIADHETEVSCLGFSGLHQINQQIRINYAAQITSDKIDSRTSYDDGSDAAPYIGGYEQGEFQSRSYFKITVLPEYKFQFDNGQSLTVRSGASFDDTNRNDSELSAIADVTWQKVHANGHSESLYLAYAESSQVPGYTAIGGSTTSGMFRSNRDLDRETSQNLELGAKINRADWSVEAALFYRWDDDLTDWTIDFDNDGPFARSASPVDIETFGIELIATKRFENFEFITSYTYLDKDEDYGNNAIDASFYALNYANHRVTFGAIWTPIDMIKFSIDNEWRSQEENALRNSDDKALFTHATLTVYPPNMDDLELFVSIDNAWDDDFEDVPGTPGRGDQYAVGATYRW
ncbi:MAG: TonB-dependent receptor domain-containing protein, partial [Opitutales bacterium]